MSRIADIGILSIPLGETHLESLILSGVGNFIALKRSERYKFSKRGFGNSDRFKIEMISSAEDPRDAASRSGERTYERLFAS